MKTRILFVLPSLESGGAERVMVHLLNNLDRERFEPSVLVGRAIGPYLADLRDDVVVTELGVAQSLKLVPKIAAHVRRVRPHIVFSTLYINFAVLLARSAFPRGTRVVVRESSVLGARLKSVASRNKARARLIERLMRSLYRRADLIVCQSDFAREELCRALKLPPAKTVRIHNPVDTVRIEAEAEAEAGAGEDETPYRGTGPHLLAVGRCRPQKAYPDLLEAFAMLRKTRPQADLAILGDGELLPQLKRFADELGVGSAVHFAGSEPKPYRWIRHADLMVSSSHYEPFSNALLEAMACGTPALATDCPGGNRELFEPDVTGWLAPAGNVPELAAALDKAIAALPGLDTEAIRQSCRRRFALGEIVPQYEAAFARLVSRGGAGA